jgi:hypothetical protein
VVDIEAGRRVGSVPRYIPDTEYQVRKIKNETPSHRDPAVCACGGGDKAAGIPAGII